MAEVKPSLLAHLSDEERARILDQALDEWRDLLDKGGACTSGAALVMVAALRAFYRETVPLLREAAQSRGAGGSVAGRVLAKGEGAASCAADEERRRGRR